MDSYHDESVISGIVALVGPPNAGKSTLLNTLLKQKISIVTPKPQTTRNRIAGVLNEPDYQIEALWHVEQDSLSAKSFVDIQNDVFNWLEVEAIFDVFYDEKEKMYNVFDVPYVSRFLQISLEFVNLLNLLCIIST